MNILIMGPAGSGKGTMSDFIADYFHIPHISTGDMFRAAIAAETPLGLEAKRYMDNGLLVPDEVTINMTKERLANEDCAEGYLLDGFPRTVVQAQAFDEIAKETNRPVEVVIDLEVSIDALAPRIVNRRVCKHCGAIYNIVTKPTKVEGICDNCGTALTHRKDDTLEALEVRMAEYYKSTEPAIKYFEEKGLVVKVDAGRPAQEVWLDIKEALEHR